MSTPLTTSLLERPDHLLQRRIAYVRGQQRVWARPRTIIKGLMKDGMSQEDAGVLLAGILEADDRRRNTPEGRKALAAHYSQLIGGGLLLTLIGGGIAYGTSLGGGKVVVFSFALAGPIAIVWGLVGWIRCRSFRG